MRLGDYQEETEQTAIYPTRGHVGQTCVKTGVAYTAFGLGGEAGEIQEKVKKAIREDDPTYLADARDELGDVLWYLCRLGDELGVDMDEVAEENISKLLDRQERDVLTGEGDNR